MNCTSHNVKVTEGNAFALILPLKSRHYVSEQPIDEDIDITLLQNVVVKVGGIVWEDVSLAVEGVTIGIPSTQARGTYNVELTAVYNDINIRAAYFECFTIVAWSYQSDVQNYIPDSPIIAEAAFFVAGNWTDAELEQLKEEYREKNAQLDQAIADAEEAKREWEEKAAELDDVAQESTLTQGVQDIREDISHIDIDTSDLAKEATLGTPLVGQPSTIFAAIAALQQGDDSKQTIVDAINYMGGSATIDMTWAQLAQQVTAIPNVLDPRNKYVDNIQTPVDLCKCLFDSGIEELWTDWAGNISLGTFSNNISFKVVHMPYVTSASANSSSPAFGRNVIKVYADRMTQIPPWSLTKAIVAYFPMASSALGGAFVNGYDLIDVTLGAGIVSNFNMQNYYPDNAWKTNTDSLCFDTDIEEYGQVFSTNFDKWKWCIINHFAANLQDRTGMTAFTITFGATVLSHFDAEMIAAFTDKNWTLA